MQIQAQLRVYGYAPVLTINPRYIIPSVSPTLYIGITDVDKDYAIRKSIQIEQSE